MIAPVPIKSYIINLLSHIFPVNKYFSGIAVIFMLHRVSPMDENRLSPNENMKVSPDFLEKFINILIKRGVEFISLDRLYDLLFNDKEVDSYKVIFTLDDGYKDNFYIAYPIFKKYNIPFTIYISPSFPDKKAPLWWYVLEDLILENDKIRLSNGIIFPTKTKAQKEKAFLEIRRLILNSLSERYIDVLNKIFEHYKIDWFFKNEELYMSWEEIIALSKEELCTIGNHTLNHLPLINLSKDTVIKEIIKANELLESKIQKKVEHFAYPFGGREEVGKREFNIVRQLNFKTVVTTRKGTIYYKHRDFLNCCLPRIMITENFQLHYIGRPRRKKIVTE